MLVEDLAILAAGVIMFLAIVIGGVTLVRWRYAKLHPPLTAEDTELQLENELEKVNKQIESLQAKED